MLHSCLACSLCAVTGSVHAFHQACSLVPLARSLCLLPLRHWLYTETHYEEFLWVKPFGFPHIGFFSTSGDALDPRAPASTQALGASHISSFLSPPLTVSARIFLPSCPHSQGPRSLLEMFLCGLSLGTFRCEILIQRNKTGSFTCSLQFLSIFLIVEVSHSGSFRGAGNMKVRRKLHDILQHHALWLLKVGLRGGAETDFKYTSSLVNEPWKWELENILC